MAKKKKKKPQTKIPKTTLNTKRTKFTSIEKSAVLDDKARKVALKARLLGLAPIVLSVALFSNYKTMANPYVVASVVLSLISFVYSTHLVHKVFIESVWRGKDKVNRTLYKNNKVYFDESFTRYGLREDS